MLIEIKNRFDGTVLFAHDAEENSMLITLEQAIKARANLRSADLSGADLSSANLSSANLRSANLRSADLSGANLRSANLYGADLRSANLYGADLRSANLYGANLRSADLSGADLSSANLSSANLYGAHLRSANLSDADLPAFQLVPEVDSFVGWKKLKGGIIAKVQIPAKAKRTSSLIGRKNRAEFVKVLWLSDNAKEGVSQHDDKTKYVVGKIVYPDSYNDTIQEECVNGIHFFITRKEAEDY